MPPYLVSTVSRSGRDVAVVTRRVSLEVPPEIDGLTHLSRHDLETAEQARVAAAKNIAENGLVGAFIDGHNLTEAASDITSLARNQKVPDGSMIYEPIYAQQINGDGAT